MTKMLRILSVMEMSEPEPEDRLLEPEEALDPRLPYKISDDSLLINFGEAAAILIQLFNGT